MPDAYAPVVIMIELFSGTGVMSAAFRDRGWHTLTVDRDPRLPADAHLDIGALDADTLTRLAGGRPDVVWASPSSFPPLPGPVERSRLTLAVRCWWDGRARRAWSSPAAPLGPAGRLGKQSRLTARVHIHIGGLNDDGLGEGDLPVLDELERGGDDRGAVAEHPVGGRFEADDW